MALDKITADKIYEHSMERVANRPTAAARFGTGGLSPAQLKARYDQLPLDAVNKINELIDKIKAGADGDTILKYMQTPIPGDDDDNPRTLYELLQDITNGDIATYLTLRSLTKTTLWDELHYIEQRLAEATSIQVAKAEAERVAAEKLRETAESGRVSAEQARVVAELGRVAAETTRRNDEQERVTDESGRAAAETARVSAEQARVVAESDRISAENTRETQEQRRQSFEQARQKDEAQRITAEQAREAVIADIIRAKESGELNGKDGRPFSISEIYGSVAEMHAGFATDNVEYGQFVLINTDDVEDPDNAKIFVKKETGYSYLTDMSGATGIEGPPGNPGLPGARGQAFYRLKSNLVGSLEYYPFTDFLIPNDFVPKPYDLVLYNDGNLGYISSVSEYEKLAAVAHIPNVTLKGPAGAPGFSPTVNVSKKDGVATVSITDANGTKTVQIYDGAAGNGTGGSGGDWNINNPAVAGYIKNRTHYKETAGAVIFSESSLAFADTLGSFTMAELADSIELEEGKTYKVSWGGVDYACVAQKDPVIGNGLYLGNGRDMGETISAEPFLIRTTKEGSYDSSSGKTEIRNYDQTYTQALEISGGEETIYHQLDPRYIPNMYYEEDGGTAEILPEITLSPIGDPPSFWFKGDLDMTVGNTYTVKWNGVDYACVAQDMAAASGGEITGVGLGNAAVLGGVNTGEPFALFYSPEYVGSIEAGYTCAGFALDGSPHVTFSIIGDGNTIHHIPPRFIKDMYYKDWVDFLPETKLTFIDSGEGVYIAPITFAEDLSTYPSYKVTYNGEVYTTSYNKEMTCMGNMALMGTGEDTGEPFLITSMGALSLTEQPPATIKIQIEGVKPIDAQYLPEPELFDFIEAGIENVSPIGGKKHTISVPGISAFMKRACKRGLCRLRFKYKEYGGGESFNDTYAVETVTVSYPSAGIYVIRFMSLTTTLWFRIGNDDTVTVTAKYDTGGINVSPT